MNLGFSQIITEIEQAIGLDYVPGCVQWADQSLSGAWSTAINRFDAALVDAIRTCNYEHAKREGQVYRDTSLALIAKYRAHMQLDEADQFLLALDGPSGEVPVPFKQGVAG